MRKFLTLLALLPGTARAEAFQPPLPEVQSATAEVSYALACAQVLVRRR